ncbi:MAG: LysR family transcriptional regulator, partial [Allgaiera sp.]|nr:LysR family transcriptional regulator [Allgaiera sp.]
MSDPPDLLSVDFAALDVLCRLHATGSFTRTAEALGVNQSAISYTIAKLRRVFDDPLFVKQAGRQVATPRCDALAAGAAQLLDAYRGLATPEVFDAGRARAEVVIACNYYERLLLIPAIARRLHEVAPGIRLTITNASSDGPKRLLWDEADLLLGPLQEVGS